MKTKIVKTKDVNEKEMTLVVKAPTPKQIKDAMLFASKVFRECVEMGALPRAKINDHMREVGLWDDKKEEQLQTVLKNLRDGEQQLRRGGKTKDGEAFTKTQARELAINMRSWRMEYALLMTAYNNMDQYSIEGAAEAAKFDYLVSVCTYFEDNTKVFKNYDHYIENSEQQYAYDSATALSSLMSGFSEETEKEWVENKFLLEHGFARDSDLRLIDKDGNLVNQEGKKIDEEGYLLNDEGKRVDSEGRLLDESGRVTVEFTPFSD